MNEIQLKAILAGLFFGIWPLFMNRSGLNGNVSSLAFAIAVAVIVFPFAFRDMGNLSNVKWVMVALAGIFAAVGLLSFNGMLSKASVAQVGTLLVLMTIVQTIVPALYHVIINHSISPMKAAGFALAAVSAVMVSKG